jgi:hypothetical protein
MEQFQDNTVEQITSQKMAMRTLKINLFLGMAIAAILASCGPKDVVSDTEELSAASISWIPFQGNESIIFEFDTNLMSFSGNGKISYFETVRYKTDQSGFFSFQKDYYADLERQILVFESPSTEFFFTYYLEKNKCETGDWDILKVSISEGIYYSNEMKIVISETDNLDKGDNFRFKSSLILGGNSYTNVYYWKQERRPFELYYTKAQGIIAFKLSSNELWTLKQQI